MLLGPSVRPHQIVDMLPQTIVVSRRFVAQTTADVIEGNNSSARTQAVDDRPPIKGPSRVSVNAQDGIPFPRIDVVHPRRTKIEKTTVL
jgi:hypothetical protein